MPANGDRLCACGGGRLSLRNVEINITAGGQAVMLRDVPQLACPSCGSRVYAADTLERLEAIMRASRTDPCLGRR